MWYSPFCEHYLVLLLSPGAESVFCWSACNNYQVIQAQHIGLWGVAVHLDWWLDCTWHWLWNTTYNECWTLTYEAVWQRKLHTFLVSRLEAFGNVHCCCQILGTEIKLSPFLASSRWANRLIAFLSGCPAEVLQPNFKHGGLKYPNAHCQVATSMFPLMERTSTCTLQLESEKLLLQLVVLIACLSLHFDNY